MFNVMIVDDYEIFRTEIRSMPMWGEATGFHIAYEASNGRDAIKKLRQNPVDLLLTDIRMPLINGLELLKKVTEEQLCSCVILMSQFSDFEYARQGLSSGAFEYLLKPVNPDDLSKALVRAAAYIIERRKEISKISYLDKMLDKNTDVFFPEKELGVIMNQINAGSVESIEFASYLVAITNAELNFDCMKTAYILNKTIKNIVESVDAEFPWITKFLNLQELKKDDFSNLADISLIKESFVRRVEIIITTIRKFELGIENSSMVRLTCKTILEHIDTDITINEISNKLFITRTYLSRIFKEKTGLNLVNYLTNVKIERAKVLLMNGSKHTEISEKLGYKDDEYFKKLFKKTTGKTINNYKSIASE